MAVSINGGTAVNALRSTTDNSSRSVTVIAGSGSNSLKITPLGATDTFTISDITSKLITSLAAPNTDKDDARAIDLTGMSDLDHWWRMGDTQGPATYPVIHDVVYNPFGEERVDNGNFDELGPQLIKNPLFGLGPELVTCGDFSCADPNDSWDLYESGSSTVTFTDVASINIDGSNSNAGLYQQNIFENSKTYKIVLTMKATAIFDAEILETEGAATRTTIGDVSLTTSYQEFTFYFIGTGNYDLFIHRKFGQTAGQNQQILISNVTVKEVIDTNNIPRISYDSNGDNGHILLEPTSTNLITYSEAFENWNNQNIDISTNQAISPNGILNATKLQPTQTSGIHILTIAETSSNVKTYSVFAKQNGYKRFRFNTGSSGNGFASFDLNTGSVASTGGTYYSSSNIEDYGNGWYRCSITFLANAPNVYTIVVEDNTGQIVFPGDGVSSIYVWGAQVEEQSYATSYIPTNGGTVTRDADVVSRLGIDEIDIPQEEGTIYLELKGYEKNTEIFNFNRSTSNSIHVFTNSAGALRVITYYEPEGTGTSANVTLNNNTNKVAIAFKNGSFIVYADGEEELNTSTFVWTPTDSIDRLYFNRGGYVASQGLSKVKALRIYKEAFNTTQLDELTS